MAGKAELLFQAPSPISGTTLSVGDCNDLNIVQALSVDKGEWKSIQNHTARAIQVWRPDLGFFRRRAKADFSSSRNSNAAVRLRLRYQSTASLDSTLVCGWYSSGFILRACVRCARRDPP